MSIIRADSIKNRGGTGAPDFPNGITVTGIVTASSLNSTATQIVAGAAVTANSGGVDTVGVVTATSFKGSGANITSINAANISTGTVPTARLGSGTASGTTYLAGDSSYKTITTSIAQADGVDVYTNHQGVNYSAGRVALAGMAVTFANTPDASSKLLLMGNVTLGHSGGDPGASLRWEYSTNNSSWTAPHLNTWNTSSGHAGLESNCNTALFGAAYMNGLSTNNTYGGSINVLLPMSVVSQARYYRITLRQCDNTDNTIYINRSGTGQSGGGFNGVGTSSLTIMEIKGT
jgi:hypothetical protein